MAIWEYLLSIWTILRLVLSPYQQYYGFNVFSLTVFVPEGTKCNIFKYIIYLFDTIRLTTHPMLYRCRLPGLNQRPTRYECVALPTELNRLTVKTLWPL